MRAQRGSRQSSRTQIKKRDEKHHHKKSLAAARKRRQRAREKSDKNLHEEKKRQERERYHRRVREGKIKRASELTSRELTKKRQAWRKSAAKHRSLRENETPENPQAISRKQKGRKQVKLNRAKVYRKLTKTETENSRLKKKVEKLKKRCSRLKKTNISPAKPLDTPKTKVKKILKGQKVSDGVKKRLLLGEVLQEQLKTAVRTKNLTEKHVLNKLMSGKILKRYKVLTTSRSFLSPTLLKKYGMDLKRKAEFIRQASLVSRNRTHDVINFFLRNDITYVCPDKKGYIFDFSNGKVKKRKRYLRDNLTELYKKYSTAIPNPVSYTTFCRLKPFYCVSQKLNERSTCLCTLCENMRLLASALYRSKVLENCSLSALISSVCCDPRTEECLQRKCAKCSELSITIKPYINTRMIDYKEWQNTHSTQRDNDGNIIKKTPKWKKIDCAESASTVVDMFKKKIDKYMLHIFRDSHQQSYFRHVKANLGPGDLYLHYDWSKNYELKSNREIQSAFYGASNEEISLHTGMAYLAGQENGFCTVSDNNKHTAPHVVAHITPILREIFEENPGVTRLFLQSDSPTSQYRNKDMFYLLTQYLTNLFPQITVITYGYSESGHGKGEADGIGGWAKSTLDQEILHGKDLSNVHEAVKVLKSRTEKVKIMLIDHDAHVEVKNAIPQNLKPFEGTTLVHSLTWIKERREELYFSSLSCNLCDAGTNCSHFGLPNSPLILAVNADDVQEQNLDDAELAPPSRKRKSNNNQTPAEKSCLQSTKPVVNGWVAVKFNNFWYPGVIEKVSPRTVVVNFLVRHEVKDDLFLWPPKEDKQQVKRSNILYYLKTPPLPVGRTFFRIPEKLEIDVLADV